MFERHQGGEKAVLVHAFFSQQYDVNDLNEFKVLVESAHIEILETLTCHRNTPHAKYYVGTGKAEEIAQHVRSLNASVVIVNHALTPSQERNLEKICECKVVDRTGLILDIFAQRARTHEGKLQVELAQLQYISTRLVRGWTHLERQKGGIGLRGPGETQLETDRRLIRQRMSLILSRLEKVEKQRFLNRQSRTKQDRPTLSFVGYTNAGKSTLFNRLTSAEVYVADQLFATLDPTLRRVHVDEVGEVVMADTVGFIRHLPHDLVASFKATLLEVKEATLLLHVVDASDPHYEETITAVNEVLSEIDSETLPTLFIMNKIDRLPEQKPHIDRNEQGEPIRVWLSAQTGEGCDLLFQALRERLGKQTIKCKLHIPAYFSKLRSILYTAQAIESEITDEQDGSFMLNIRMLSIEWERLCKQYPDLMYFVIK